MTARATWALIAIVLAAAALVMGAHGLSLDWPTTRLPALACLVLTALAAFYHSWRRDERLAVVLTGTAQLVAFSAGAEVLSYAVAAFDAPLWDSAFASWDRALGLDWHAYLVFVEAHPWLATAYGVAYNSILPQFIIVTAGLGLSGRLAACRTFVAAVVVSGLAITVISAFLPATSMFLHLGLVARDYPHLDMAAVFTSIVPFEGLRNGTLQIISLRDAEGIITFPSYHAALGVILAHAFWRLPLVRWPGLALNLTMIASTPLNGGHYFVDVIAGAAAALAALAVARTLVDAPTAKLGRAAPSAEPLGRPISARA